MPALVREVLGAPTDRQVRGAQEAWQYCATGVVQDTFVVVWFAEGAVTGMTTYNNAVGDIGFSVRATCSPSGGTRLPRSGATCGNAKDGGLWKP